MATQTRLKPGRGRPAVHSEPWSKVSVVLFERQVETLDLLRNELSRRAGHAVSRATVIRVAVDMLLEAIARRSRRDIAELRRRVRQPGMLSE